MSDNLRRYRAIRQALKQWYPGEPQGKRIWKLRRFSVKVIG